MESETNNDKNTLNQTPVEVEVIKNNQLPSFVDCLSDGWDFVTSRFDALLLVIITALPSLYLSLMVGDNEDFYVENVELTLGVFAWLIIITPLVYLVVTYLALYNAERPTVSMAINHAFNNIWAYFWLLSIVSLVMLGGFMAFIIPGIIISTYATFALSTFVYEKKRGLSAILSSHQLVRGFWWGVFGRVFGVSILWGIVAGIITVFGQVGMVLGTVVQSAGVVATLFVVTKLYHARLAGFDYAVAKPAPSSLYQIFTALGLLVLIGIVGLGLIGWSFMTSGFSF